MALHVLGHQSWCRRRAVYQLLCRIASEHRTLAQTSPQARAGFHGPWPILDSRRSSPRRFVQDRAAAILLVSLLQPPRSRHPPLGGATFVATATGVALDAGPDMPRPAPHCSMSPVAFCRRVDTQCGSTLTLQLFEKRQNKKSYGLAQVLPSLQGRASEGLGDSQAATASGATYTRGGRRPRAATSVIGQACHATEARTTTQ
jgi:hypothetical protein